MTENTQSQILKPGRIFGSLAILLLMVCLVIKILATSWAGTQSGEIAIQFHAKLLTLAIMLAFVGYYRIGAIGKNVGAVMFFIIIIPLFLLTLLLSSGARLGVVAVLVIMFFMPLWLVFHALKEKSVEFWKRLVPLSIPIFIIISSFLGTTLIGGIFVYIGIGLVAVVALMGKE